MIPELNASCDPEETSRDASLRSSILPGPAVQQVASGKQRKKTIDQWIGLRENLQETMVFTIKYRAFL